MTLKTMLDVLSVEYCPTRSAFDPAPLISDLDRLAESLPWSINLSLRLVSTAFPA